MNLENINKYTEFLKRIIAANERAVEHTNYEFHKGGLKAYRDCLSKFNEFVISSDLKNH